ncbi:MAG: hypothetical protein WC608_01100 [Parcubacteria group bacterium]
MKKSIRKLVFVVILLLLPLSAFAAEKVSNFYEHSTVKQAGTVIEDREYKASLLIPSPGATPEEIEKIIQRERKILAEKIKKQNKELLETKDTMTAKAIDGQNNTLSAFIAKDGILDKMNKSLSSVSSDIGYMASTFWVIWVILILTLFSAIWIFRIRGKQKVNQLKTQRDLEEIAEQVKDIHDKVVV